jgi:prepilin-type N-terminal cleavage/methylation domain-containing protein
MYHKPITYAKGFSLIEVLVYMAVLTVIAFALVTTFLSFDTTLVRNRTERIVAEEARVALDTMTQSIRNATGVNVALSTIGSSPGALALDVDGDVALFYVLNGVLMYALNGEDVSPLTSDAVTIEDITFNHFVGSSTDLVRITLTLFSETKAASTTRTFYSSGVVRNTYE